MVEAFVVVLLVVEVAARVAGESGFRLTLIIVLSMLSMKLPSKQRSPRWLHHSS